MLCSIPAEISRNDPMNACKECELAVYCYSDSATWIFRTKQEMEEKRAAMWRCPQYKELQEKHAKKDVQTSLSSP